MNEDKNILNSAICRATHRGSEITSIALFMRVPSECFDHGLPGEPQRAEAKADFSLICFGIPAANARNCKVCTRLRELGYFLGFFVWCHSPIRFNEQAFYPGIRVPRLCFISHTTLQFEQLFVRLFLNRITLNRCIPGRAKCPARHRDLGNIAK